MSKALDLFMVAIISGIAAFTTSKLGLAGTIIGAVIGSMLYQIMSYLVREPLENVKTQKIEREIFYVFPLILIAGIELIYFLSTLYFTPDEIFHFLEYATGGNLFRTMGISLMVMGVYPILKPESISMKYGIVVMAVGLVKLLWGLVDVNSPLVSLYSSIFFQFNEVISVVVIIALSYVILSLIRESVTLILEKDNKEDQ
jgi:hypothetical protein